MLYNSVYVDIDCCSQDERRRYFFFFRQYEFGPDESSSNGNNSWWSGPTRYLTVSVSPIRDCPRTVASSGSVNAFRTAAVGYVRTPARYLIRVAAATYAPAIA